MKFGLAAWGLRETALAEQLAMNVALGGAYVELGIGSFRTDWLQPESTAADLANVQACFKAHQQVFFCAATGNDFDGTNAAESLAATRKVLNIAGELGIQYLRIFGGFTPLAQLSAAARATELACLRETAQQAVAAGVIPAMETHGAVEAYADGVRHLASSSTDPETVATTLAEIPELSLNFDPANLWAVGVDPLAFFDRFQDRIRYVHLKDFRILPSGAIQGGACGEGKLPWAELMSRLQGFTGPVLIEYEQTADIRDGFRRSMEFLQSWN